MHTLARLPTEQTVGLTFEQTKINVTAPRKITQL